jgi:hypothetical protein
MISNAWTSCGGANPWPPSPLASDTSGRSRGLGRHAGLPAAKKVSGKQFAPEGDCVFEALRTRPSILVNVPLILRWCPSRPLRQAAEPPKPAEPMTLAPLLDASPQIQVRGFAAIAAFGLEVSGRCANCFGENKRIVSGDRLEEPGLELLTMSAVIRPVARGRDPLTGGNDSGMANDSDEIAVASRLHPDDAKAVLAVLVGYALDQPGKHLPVGWLWLRPHAAHRTGLVAKRASEYHQRRSKGRDVGVLMEGLLSSDVAKTVCKMPVSL